MPGPFRTRLPHYVALLPPCNHACPAGENIQAWLALAQAGEYRQAWETLMADNPLPATHGRVCYHPCETACNRAELDAAVSIHAVERFLGDMATAEGWTVPMAPATGKRVLVVGAGPSGLSAAYHLARLGHQVEIHEAGPLPGGMLHFGIPAYRLPRADLLAEIARIERMGVTHRAEPQGRPTCWPSAMPAGSTRCSSRSARMSASTSTSRRATRCACWTRWRCCATPAPAARRCWDAAWSSTAAATPRWTPRARLRRLGADEALIVYRRDRAHMPAHGFEADEALDEGVKIKWLTTIKEIVGPTLTVERMALDDKGRPQPTGEFETLEADAVVLALGQDSDSDFLRKVPGVEFKWDTVVVDRQMMTGHPGVFAGGDMVPAERTVTVAVGHGKKAARCIDAWLRGATYDSAASAPVVTLRHAAPAGVQRRRSGGAARIWRTGTGCPGSRKCWPACARPQARHEAQRCLSCGNCFECDNCYAACPEQAIAKLGPGLGYSVDAAKCTGCAVCFEQCPCHAIEMVAEPDADAQTPLPLREGVGGGAVTRSPLTPSRKGRGSHR